MQELLQWGTIVPIGLGLTKKGRISMPIKLRSELSIILEVFISSIVLLRISLFFSMASITE
jgi:DNA-binding transcriptional regulator/RsmH inhibitor MraZ